MTRPNYVLPRADFARADFKPALFDSAIKQKGYRVTWEQGMFCSCYMQVSGQPDYTCPICKGKGYIYIKPVETKVLVTSINGRKEQDRLGLNDLGTAYLTPLSTDNVGFRDRFTFLDSTTKYSQVIKKSGDTVELRYPILNMIAAVSLGTELLPGLHFLYEEMSNVITWTDECTLSDGTQVSFLYDTKPVYIALGPIHELRGTYSMAGGGGAEYYVPLPKQYQIKREDYMDKADTGYVTTTTY